MRIQKHKCERKVPVFTYLSKSLHNPPPWFCCAKMLNLRSQINLYRDFCVHVAQLCPKSACQVERKGKHKSVYWLNLSESLIESSTRCIALHKRPSINRIVPPSLAYFAASTPYTLLMCLFGCLMWRDNGRTT